MAKIIIGKQFPHPADAHLFMCLVDWGGGKYSTHMLNTSSEKKPGFLAHGNYFDTFALLEGASFASVLRDFADRCEQYGVLHDAKQIVNVEVGAA